ncbi:5-formyltetrahydrofolate cyclo-ligase [Alteriqipengyuania sp. NZ-12B]|uniref:5-formyltetrahydrofolate cyclo-ligase n=1 Tax=Alteriqipengyuania abyssalis TaxID=2860200 RepID=A0ABS7PA35_9SPHN|nr:5-formyltetrahydrofolate cyclo-ligase [Alteriqipengyuania abyssalis]MBY8335926.1 5-formyltetrahydrofolate cyclo-ligase [Alteriqipengyuania abyssalis]
MDHATIKSQVRKDMRAARKASAAQLPEAVRTLVFSRPPAPVLARIPEGATIGLYRAQGSEAPAARYAQYFIENGHAIALPRLSGEDGAMQFAAHTDPLGESDLEAGPHDLMQPGEDAALLVPDVVFVPLLAFDEDGGRLGQGGGYYDRWIAEHPDALRIGLAWDAQKVDSVPLEPHDEKLHMVVTPQRVYEMAA